MKNLDLKTLRPISQAVILIYVAIVQKNGAII